MAKNEVGEIRPGQLITTFGPGAIIDSIDDSLMVLDIKYWERASEKLYDTQLSEFLHSDYFIKIPTGGRKDLPAIPFPYYHVCSNNRCRRLFDIRLKFNMRKYLEDGPICSNCESKAYPARFLISCEDNHLEDFPWHWWAHGKNDGYESCIGKLTLSSTGNSSGLDSLIVRCDCQEKGYSLLGAMTEGNFKEYTCKGHHPHRMEFKRGGCSKNVIPLQRGASNVYFPAIRSAITIRDQKPYKSLFIEKRTSIDELVKNGKVDILRTLFEHSSDYNVFKKQGLTSFESFFEEWNAFVEEQESNKSTYTRIKEIEYNRFTNFNGRCTIPEENPEFEAETQEVPYDLAPYFNNITQIHRLKEIMVLLGFMRNESPEPEVEDPKNIVWLESGSQAKWFPAVEVYGEGIFLELNREMVDSWMKKVSGSSEAYSNLHKKWLEAKGWSLEEKDGLYVMLHTLSHLIIKQLSLTSGYSSVAIKERIYCSDKMAGILLYTGSMDQEGSLGGLVEMGRIEKFRLILKKALEEAIFCTNDPVCASMEINEENDLNGCACFACSMIAETSCENGNRLLDRSLLVPLINNKTEAFFKGLIP
ncbi:DUF1998 domain-containing protein [Aneurinibacillus aneurinilyticus]|jgi:hypothetical protein|uniref:DUF1998 domain-containing protein n=1 Tax=Aneurinibacillus aneurinilyticus TaxID=1391 RepID=UPI0023F963E1|nr:DUF1998 domain-containing protein [Aneurinibacillus aneurinilyticus]MCI1696641.1 DUF1998 domain-containing protein [Aneurinibacillus aneurinilyticus]